MLHSVSAIRKGIGLRGLPPQLFIAKIDTQGKIRSISRSGIFATKNPTRRKTRDNCIFSAYDLSITKTHIEHRKAQSSPPIFSLQKNKHHNIPHSSSPPHQWFSTTGEENAKSDRKLLLKIQRNEHCHFTLHDRGV